MKQEALTSKRSVSWGSSRQLYDRYEMPIYIVENGYGYDDLLVDGVINDDYRIDYMRKHIEEMKKAVEEGVDCRGYLSLDPIDILSSRAQMKKRYGFVYVNRDNDDLKDMRRIKKKSFEWYKNVISSNGKVLQGGVILLFLIIIFSIIT